MILLAFVVVLIIACLLFFNQKKFGRRPTGDRLKLIKQSSHNHNEDFENLSETPNFTNGDNMFNVTKNFIFNKDKRSKPEQIMPTQKTDLHTLKSDENILVWFGHSSYFMQIDGKTILVDPVFSGSASPIPATTRSFAGTDVYDASDFPEIDYLFISHDHWDHLDYETVLKLKPKIKTIITGLGTGEHFEYWGFNPKIIIEKDWNQQIELEEGWFVNITPSRHFSGRSFVRNKALWVSFVLQTPTKKFFLGGDSGYDSHFAKIGTDFGPFDLAIVECGQYNQSWNNIHLMPDEMIPVATDLRAKVLLPVHWGKFSLSLHAWDEPIKLITKSAKENNQQLLTPMIGEKINLDEMPILEAWWEKLN